MNRSGLSTQPWGEPVLSVMVPVVLLPIICLQVRTSSNELQRGLISFLVSFCGVMVLNAAPVPKDDFFSSGMMVADFRHLGITAWCGDVLKTYPSRCFIWSCSLVGINPRQDYPHTGSALVDVIHHILCVLL